MQTHAESGGKAKAASPDAPGAENQTFEPEAPTERTATREPQSQPQPAQQEPVQKAEGQQATGEQEAGDQQQQGQPPQGQQNQQEEAEQKSRKNDDNLPLPTCHYEALGVQATATESEIKKEYYKLCRRVHPDKNGGDPNATARFQRILEAYQILSTKDKRAEYDARIFVKKVFQRLGLAVDERVVTFVQRCYCVEKVQVIEKQVDRRLVERLTANTPYLRQMSGADFYTIHSATIASAVVLIAGLPGCVEKGIGLLSNFVKEATGQQAPADGLILIVPRDATNRIPQMAQVFATLNWQYGAQLVHADLDRIVIRGARLPAVVVHLQQYFDFRARVLFPTGHELDAWQYAHYCEQNNISGGLLPQAEPEAATVRKLFFYVLQMPPSTPIALVSLAVKALTTVPRLTTAIVRAASSVPVHSEFSSLSPKASAPVICAFHRLLTTSQLSSSVHPRFASLPQLKSLQAIGPFLEDAKESLLIRSRGYVAAKEAVPDDDQWHGWEDILRPDGSLALFWKDLRKKIQERSKTSKTFEPPPAEWHTVPEIVSMVLEKCTGPGLEVDPKKGLRRKKLETPRATSAASPPPPRNVEVAEAAEVSKEEEEETLIEHAEDVILELSKERDPAAYQELGMVTLQTQKRYTEPSNRLSKKWYEQHKASFDVKKVGASETRVRLCQTAQKRAEMRATERQNEGKRRWELNTLGVVLPKLAPDSLPRMLCERELAGLLVLMGERSFPPGLASSVLRRLCRRSDGTAKSEQFLSAIAPFSSAQLMRSIVACERMQQEPKEQWDQESLTVMMTAAARDMHDQPSRFCAPLQSVKSCVLASGHKPFVDLFRQRTSDQEKALPTSAALRLKMELVQDGTCVLPGYSSFRYFGELCGALATLYVQVRNSLCQSYCEEVLSAFDKVAGCCRDWGNGAPAHHRGLQRLAYSFAVLGDVATDKFATACKLGLEGIGRVLLSCEMTEESGWNTEDLAVLAVAFKKCPDEKIYGKLAAAAAMLANAKTAALPREHVAKLLGGFHQAGYVQKLDNFLKPLQEVAWFKKNVSDAQDKELPGLLAGLCRAQDADGLAALDQILQKDNSKDIALNTLISMLKGLSGISGLKVAGLRSTLLKTAIAATNRSKHPATDDVEMLVQACAEDAVALRMLKELICNRRRLENIPKPDVGWKDLATCFKSILGPFARAKQRVQRLEAACGARMMQALDQTSASHSGDDLLTAASQFSEDALALMPTLVEKIALVLGKAAPAKRPSEDLTTLIQLLVKALQAQPELGDELDTWIEQIEALLLEGPAERRLDHVQMQLMGKEHKKLREELTDALGSSWLSIVLVRSRRMAWSGGQSIRLEAPRPKAALRTPELGALVPEALKLQPEPPLKSGAARGAHRSRSREGARKAEQKASNASPHETKPKAASKPAFKPATAATAAPAPETRPKANAKAAASPVSLIVKGGTHQGMASTVQGKYRKEGSNHKRPVFKRVELATEPVSEKVLIYYWDDRDGSDGQGWWFGAEVGGQNAYLYNAADGPLPPPTGWLILSTDEVDPELQVSVTTRRPPGAAPKGKAKTDLDAGPGPLSSAPLAFGEPKEPLEATAASKPGSRESPDVPPATSAPAPLTPPAPRAPAVPVDPSAEPESKRARTDGPDGRQGELWKWLQELDCGKGQMLRYFDVLAQEFDADLRQIAAAKVDRDPREGLLNTVEPSFWEAVQVEKAGHKMLFARGIAALQ